MSFIFVCAVGNGVRKDCGFNGGCKNIRQPYTAVSLLPTGTQILEIKLVKNLSHDKTHSTAAFNHASPGIST